MIIMCRLFDGYLRWLLHVLLLLLIGLNLALCGSLRKKSQLPGQWLALWILYLSVGVCGKYVKTNEGKGVAGGL